MHVLTLTAHSARDIIISIAAGIRYLFSVCLAVWLSVLADTQESFLFRLEIKHGCLRLPIYWCTASYIWRGPATIDEDDIAT